MTDAEIESRARQVYKTLGLAARGFNLDTVEAIARAVLEPAAPDPHWDGEDDCPYCEGEGCNECDWTGAY